MEVFFRLHLHEILMKKTDIQKLYEAEYHSSILFYYTLHTLLIINILSVCINF